MYRLMGIFIRSTASNPAHSPPHGSYSVTPLLTAARMAGKLGCVSRLSVSCMPLLLGGPLLVMPCTSSGCTCC